MGFPGSSVGKESTCNAGDLSLITGLGRSFGEGNGNPLQYSCLEIPWTEQSGGLQSMELQAQQLDVTEQQIGYRSKIQPTSVIPQSAKHTYIHQPLPSCLMLYQINLQVNLQVGELGFSWHISVL